MGVQVRTATFQKDGVTPRPVLERQFISFSWGGKNIEDFDLLVVFNDRLSKSIYGSFNDTTTNYTYIDGQSYWGTTMDKQEISFTLATDGMDSKKYEEFKAYFKPGIARELILSEYPFRYAMARVSSAPELSVLPFEKKITNATGTFRTTEYKGEINLTLVLDDPYWYNTEEGAYFSGELSEEQKKDIYETGTPLFTNSAWYPNQLYVAENGSIKNTVSSTGCALHYVGTALGLPILKVRYNIELNNTGVPYIVLPYSSYSTPQVNSISIGDSIMNFTLPSLLSSYNQALKIVEDIQIGESVVEIKARIREQTSNPIARKWAIAALSNAVGSEVAITEGHKTNYYARMKTLFHTNCNVIFIFNSISGEITAQYNAILTDEANQVYSQVNELTGSCLKSAMLTIPQKTPENNGVFTLNAPNATELSIDYKYRFY